MATARESSIHKIGTDGKKPHPARLLSMKCDTLLNKFRRRVTDPMDSDDEA